MSSQLKNICEEYLSTGNSDEILVKQLQKLSTLIRTNDKNQKEIFIQLSEKGLNKLLNGMRDMNLEIRKHSAKVTSLSLPYARRLVFSACPRTIPFP